MRYGSLRSHPIVGCVPAPALSSRKLMITLDLMENADERPARVLICRSGEVPQPPTTMALRGCAQGVALKARIAARRVIGPQS